MFAKLLKHEWRATREIIGLLCVIILVSSLAVGLSMRQMVLTETQETIIIAAEAEENNSVLEIMCIFLMMAGIIAIAICCAGAIFLLISRFYKRCFTDEGYLTFTLPVSNHQILLSSIVNTVAGMAVTVLAAILGGVIIFALFLTVVPETIIWADVAAGAKEVWQQICESLAENGKEAMMVGFGAVVGAFATLIELMLAVTIGALVARKHKIIIAAAVYYGINVAMSFVQSLLFMTTALSQNLSWLMGSTILISLAMAVGGYFLMYFLTSRKLNLT